MTSWQLSELVGAEPSSPFSAVFLNYVLPSASVVSHLAKHAARIVCADGGANRLRDSGLDIVPDAIVGDLDSIREDVAAYYREKRVSIIEDGDQYSTDMDKAVRWAIKQDPNDDIVIVASMGGRLDHSLSNINSAFTAKANVKFFFVNSDCLGCLLLPGSHTLLHDPSRIKPTCGLLPIFGPAIVTTKGLRWDLTAAETRFGGLVSTSNHVEGSEVHVETDAPLIWTIEY